MAPRTVWQDFKCQTIVCVADRAPEGQCSLVRDQDIYRQSLCLWPHLRAQNLNCSAPNPMASSVTHDKKLPEINLFRLFSKKRVRYNLATLFVNDTGILA